LYQNTSVAEYVAQAVVHKFINTLLHSTVVDAVVLQLVQANAKLKLAQRTIFIVQVPSWTIN
jgi:hypothetical protein